MLTEKRYNTYTTVLTGLMVLFALPLMFVMPFEVMHWQQAVNFLVYCITCSIFAVVCMLGANERVDRMGFADAKAYAMTAVGVVVSIGIYTAVFSVIIYAIISLISRPIV